MASILKEVLLASVEAGHVSTRRAASIFTLLGVLQRGTIFILVPVLSYHLTPSELGSVATITAVYVLIGALFGGIFEPAVIRYSAVTSDTSAGESPLWTAKVWLLVGSPLLGGTIGTAVLLSSSELLGVTTLIWLLEILAGGISAFSLSFAAPLLRTRRSLVRYAILAGATTALTVLSKVVFVVAMSQGVSGWAYADLATACGTYLIGFYLVKEPRLEKHATWKLNELLRFSLPLLPHVTSSWVINFLTRPIMAATMTLAATGKYWMAYNAANAGLIIAFEINRAVQVDYAKDSLPGPSAKVRVVAQTQVMAGAALTLLINAAAPIFVFVLLPPEYNSVLILLGVMSPIPVVWMMYSVIVNVLVLTVNNSRWNWLCSLSGATVVVSGTFLLGGPYGEVGVAFALLACYIVMLLVAGLLARMSKLDYSWTQVGLPATGWVAVASSVLIASSATVFFNSWGLHTLLVLLAAAILSTWSVPYLKKRRGAEWLIRNR